MKLLQTRNQRWYIEQRQIISKTRHLKDAVYCSDVLDYATMNASFLVPETYKEMAETLLYSYAAFLRFYENFQHDPRYCWINSDHDSVVLELLYGRKCRYIGPISPDYYNSVKHEIKALSGRSVVVERDWYVRFRDELILCEQ